jgi:hypothetical protein
MVFIKIFSNKLYTYNSVWLIRIKRKSLFLSYAHLYLSPRLDKPLWEMLMAAIDRVSLWSSYCETAYLNAIQMKHIILNVVFWAVTPCGPIGGCQSFRKGYYSHIKS